MSSLVPAHAPAGDGDAFDAFFVELTGGTTLASRDSREIPSTLTSVLASAKATAVVGEAV
jgi:hypothetical protein